jgi:flagellin
MPQVVNTNVYSLNAQRSLNKTQTLLQTSLERLSSGIRINSAGDDAAGLAISEGLTAQIRGMEQAVRNANDGISLVQTAEGGLEEVSSMLQRMRELAVQASNGTFTSTDRSYLQEEFLELQAEVARSSEATEFNGIDVLASTQALTIQVGHGTGANYTLTVSTITISAKNTTGIGSALAATTLVSTTTRANSSISIIDTAIINVNSYRAQLGAKQNRLEHAVNNLQSNIENQTTARSRIVDADFAVETASLTRAQILQQAGTAVLAQANQIPAGVLSLLN